MPNIVELPSDCFFVHTISKSLYILCHCSSNQRAIFIQSKWFEKTFELVLNRLWKIWVSNWNKAASCYSWWIWTCFIGHAFYQWIVVLFIKFWIKAGIHLVWPTASFLRQLIACYLTGGWSREASTFNG